MTVFRRSVSVIASLAALLAASPAGASPLLEMVGSPLGPTSLSARFGSATAGTAYFNPALLMGAKPGLQIGVLAVGQKLDVGLMARPDNANVSEDVFSARQKNPDGTLSVPTQRPLPTESLPAGRGTKDLDDQNLYTVIGTVVPLIAERLTMGFVGVIPAATFQAQRPYFVDEREQFFSNSLQFERLGDRTEFNSFAVGLGARLHDVLHLGLGVTMANDAVATNPIFMADPTDQSSSMVNSSIEVRTRFVPHAGLELLPRDGLSITATAHGPFFSRVDGVSDVRLWNFPYPEGEDSIEQRFDYVYGYEPLRLAVGGRADIWQAGEARWEGSAGATWARWSEYLDRHGDRPNLPWNDTLSLVAGLHGTWAGQRLSVEASYVPSPVPEQTGRTNYVDNDRLAGALGWETQFQLGPVGLEAGVLAQVHRLTARETLKSADSLDPVLDEFPDAVNVRTGEDLASSAGLQTNNPGYPGYTSAGWLVGLGTHLRLQF